MSFFLFIKRYCIIPVAILVYVKNRYEKEVCTNIPMLWISISSRTRNNSLRYFSSGVIIIPKECNQKKLWLALVVSYMINAFKRHQKLGTPVPWF